MTGSGVVTIQNGTVNYDGVTTGSTARLICNDGFVPGGDSRNRMCMSDGTWSSGNQICVPSGNFS